MVDIKQLAKQFNSLIAERDLIVDFGEDGYNERCTEIDDVLIPQIIKQVPQGTMNEFNTSIHSILESSKQENKIPPLEKDIDPSWINSFKGCI